MAQPRISGIFAGLLLGAVATVCPAQTTGSIEGVVLDPSRAAVGGAAVKVIESGTQATRSLETDGAGLYRALRLAPGVYAVSISKPGFRDEIRRDVALGAGQAARIDFLLQLGEARDRIEVADLTPLVSTSTADWGVSVEREAMENLPLNGRDLFELASQEQGATVAVSADRGLSNGPGIKISVNGARPNQNGFLYDGIYVNDASASAPASAAGGTLGLEAVREIRLVTSPFSAEYGRAAGAVVTAVSKSGANGFHGSGYEYFRNSALDARNFFDPPGQKAPPLRRNQFGGLASGPVLRDRLFFVLNYEAIREMRGSTMSALVPTAAAREGLLPGPGGGMLQVGVAPQVRPYLELYPLPNGRDFGDGTAGFVSESVQSTREDYAAGKLDYVRSSRLRFSARYTFDDGASEAPDALRFWFLGSESRYQFVHTEVQYVYSAQTINNVRLGFSRVLNGELGRTRPGVPASLSFVPGRPVGSIEVTGLTDVGGTRVYTRPRRFVLNGFPLSDDFVHVRGRHTVRLGAGYDRVQLNQVGDVSAGGRYQFSSLQDLLEAKPRTADVTLPESSSARGWRQNLFFAYVQDEYRASQHLSASLGVRYEGYSVPVEVNGRMASLRDPLRDDKITLGGPIFLNPSKENFAPRASLAWDPARSGKMVVRAGAGIFFDLLSARELLVAGMRMPPFYERVYLSRPAFPNLLGEARNTPPRKSVDSVDYQLNQPYVVQFQFSLERRIGQNEIVRLGYAGARGVHLLGRLYNMNSARPDVLPGGTLYFPANAARLNPAFEQIGLRRSQFNSAYHAFQASFENRWGGNLRLHAKYTWGKSIDETSSGVTTDFTNSTDMPTVFNYRGNRGLSDFDLRHSFSANFSWRILPPGSTPAGKALGGWEAHGMVQAQTGNPFTPTIGFDRARLRPGSGDLDQRPDLAALGSRLILGSPDQYFNPLAFSLPAAGFYGNLGRNVLAGPGLAALNFALHKALWQREEQTLRLRVEFFNLTNHPNFGIPSERKLFNSNLQRLGSAGRITSTSTSSRQVQLAVRWTF